MSAGEYLTGLGYFAVTFGAVFAATALIVRSRLSHLSGADLVVAFSVVATAGLIGVHMAPGILEILTRAAVAVTALLFLGAAFWLARRSPEAVPGDGRQRPDDGGEPQAAGSDRFVWWCVLAAIAAFSAEALIAIFRELGEPSTRVDTTTFHLPQVARWIQTESIWGIHQFIPLQAHANYPHNGDIIHLASVLPWRNDAFARAASWPYVAIAGISVYALARRIGTARGPAALGAGMFVCIPSVIFAATGGALTDPTLAAMFGAGLLFGVRYLQQGRMSDLVLAGVGLGLAFGTKWYGISSVIVVVGLWFVASLSARRRQRTEVLRDTGIVAGLVALCGGFWLLRNWVGSENPVFPVKLELFGLTVFDAPTDSVREQFGWNIAHYAGDIDVLTGPVADGLWYGWSLVGVALLVGLILGAGGLLSKRPSNSELAAVRSFLILAVALFAVYLITPYTALGFEGNPIGVGFNARYALPALLIACVVYAWCMTTIPRLALPLGALGVLAALLGLDGGFEPTRAEWLAAAAAAIVAVFGFEVWRARPERTPPRLSRGAAAALSILALSAAGAAAYERQQAFNEGRYEQDPALAWIANNAPEGERVGIDGEWTVTQAAPVLPAFGPSFENDVEYLGSFESGFLAPYSDERSWRRAVDAEDFDLIVIGRLKPGRAERVADWAFSAGYRLIARSPNLLLMAKDAEPQPVTARAA